MLTAFISRFGDRKQENGCAIDKIGMNIYRLSVPDGPRPFVFVETTEHRTAVVNRIKPLVFDIRTFNTLNGYHPGSDLQIRVYREGDSDLLARGEFTPDGLVSESVPLGLWRDGSKKMLKWHDPRSSDLQQVSILVQPQGRTHAFPVIEQHDDNKISIETLITRTPPTPVETNIEIAVVRSLGPLRSR